jgi:hypothetical protein
MSPQLLWTIAGLILTVLTLGGVTISSYQSMDSASAKLVASEVGNIATTTKLWMANESTNGTFNGIDAAKVGVYIPDLVATGTGATSRLASKAVAGANFAVASTTPFANVVITVASVTAAQAAAVHASLQGKACTSTYVAAATTLTYTCAG